MDWNRVASDWDHYKACVKARWSRMTPAHLEAIAGNRDRLAQTLRELYGISADEIEKQIRYFEARNQDYRPSTTSCSAWRRVEP